MDIVSLSSVSHCQKTLITPPFQIIDCLTFLTSILTARLIQKKLCKYSQI
jgi:hypothetical protein